jgi:hypothetical protein
MTATIACLEGLATRAICCFVGVGRFNRPYDNLLWWPKVRRLPEGYYTNLRFNGEGAGVRGKLFILYACTAGL